MPIDLRDDPAIPPRVRVRDANEGDLPELTHLRPPEAMHSDRLAASDGTCLRYLVVESGDILAGFVNLAFAHPPGWPPSELFPALVDLWIRPSLRGRGIGTCFLGQLEQISAARGFDALHVQGDPVDNRRAYDLYRRLGYEPLQDEPYLDEWSYVMSDGQVQSGREWAVDMRKRLRPGAA